MSGCPPCPTPDDCYCDQALALQEKWEGRRRGSQIRMEGSQPPPQIQTHAMVVDQPGGRCLRCRHTRGVHKPHCRVEAGCGCGGFV